MKKNKKEDNPQNQKGNSGSEGSKLIEGTDFIWDSSGLMVFTAAYLKKRGYCCKSGCRNCPYGFCKS
jgi:hypothetical protein